MEKMNPALVNPEAWEAQRQKKAAELLQDPEAMRDLYDPDTAAYYYSGDEICNHDIDIIVRPAQEAVADITADDKGPYALFSGRVGDDPEDRMVQISFGQGHTISSHDGAFSRKRKPSPVRPKRKVFTPFVIAIYLTFKMLL